MYICKYIMYLCPADIVWQAEDDESCVDEQETDQQTVEDGSELWSAYVN
jgi:hypothetical protein